MANERVVFRGRSWLNRAGLMAALLVIGAPLALAVELSAAPVVVHAVMLAPYAAVALYFFSRPARTAVVLREDALAVRWPAPPHPRTVVALASIEAFELRAASPRRYALRPARTLGLYAHADGERRLLFASTDEAEVLACGRAVLGAAAAWRAGGGALHARLQAALERRGERAPTAEDFAVDLSRPALDLTPKRPPASWETVGVLRLTAFGVGATSALGALTLLIEARVATVGVGLGLGALACALGAVLWFMTPRRATFSPAAMLAPLRSVEPTPLAALGALPEGRLVLVTGRVAAIDRQTLSLLGAQPAVLSLINTVFVPPHLVGPRYSELDPEGQPDDPRARFAVGDGAQRIEIDVGRARIALPSTALRWMASRNVGDAYTPPLDVLADSWRACKLPPRYEAAGPLGWAPSRVGGFRMVPVEKSFFERRGGARAADFSPHYLDEWALAEGDAVAVLGTIRHLPADASSPLVAGGYRDAGRAPKLVIDAQLVGPA